MSLESLTETVRSKVGANSGLNASVKFSFAEGGVIFVDGKASPNTVSNEDKDADCTIKIGQEDFEQMLAGALNGMTAFMSGKLKVEGDMSVAMNLDKVV